MRKKREDDSSLRVESTRREFIKGATSVAAGLAVPKAFRAEGAELLPSVAFGPHCVTRLIVGSNPIYGYSHFNKLYDQHMLEWFTDERIVKLLVDCEKAGINTWQASFNWNMRRQFPKIRGAGCQIQFICLVASWHYDENMARTPEAILDGTIKCAKAAAQFKPLGVAFHGGATETLARAGKLDLIKIYLNPCPRYGNVRWNLRAQSRYPRCAARQRLAERLHTAGLHNLTRCSRRTGLGDRRLPVPGGEGFIASDPPRMAEAVRRVDEPTLVYKVLAAGRKCDSEEEKSKAIEWAFKNIKPTDATIIGLYPRFSDQVTETTRMVRTILA